MMNFNEMGKVELRAACKEAGIKNYGKMTNALMREALEAHYADAEVEQVESVQVETEAEQVAPATESASVAEQDLDALELTEDDNCPHCGIHLSNGIGTFDQLVDLHGIEKARTIAQLEFQCMACDGEWGPKVAQSGKGIKIEKDREERNGVKRPSIGGACRMVWDYLDDVVAAGDTPTIKQVKATAEEYGWNVNNASIEFYQWRKFHGIRGRQPKA